MPRVKAVCVCVFVYVCVRALWLMPLLLAPEVAGVELDTRPVSMTLAPLSCRTRTDTARLTKMVFVTPGQAGRKRWR